MTIEIKPKTARVIKEADVLVVGGGPAGIGAAVSAAKSGMKVLLLEKRGFLGGNITGSFVENCNYFYKGSTLRQCGVWSDMADGYRAEYGAGHDIRPDSKRFSSEYLKIFLDKFMKENKIEVLFHSLVNDVVVENGKIKAVIIQSKQGPVAAVAKVVVDATGDGDVAFAAGVPFDQGRDTDGLCQPGTLSFRIAGVNSALLMEGGIDKLNAIGRQYRLDYRAGKTGLTCKRQDLPFGRLTAGGQISYLNYPCEYGVDSTNIEDLTKGEINCRGYIDEMMHYIRGNFEGFEHAELAAIGTEICFRDSRRIRGRYKLTLEDMENDRAFDDCIAVYPKFYDMLAPDAYMDGDGAAAGKGYKGHIYVPVKDDGRFQIPFGSLVPEKIDNLLVSGRCISADHVAQSGIRAISACMLTGEAAGAAAGISVKSNVLPGDVDVKELQGTLRKQGVYLP